MVRLLSVVAVMLMGAYALASTASAWIMSEMMNATLTSFDRPNSRQGPASFSIGPTSNYRDIRKAVMDRNVFNSAGEFPDEEPIEDDVKKSKVDDFDFNAPCVKSSLKLTLVGTIVIGPDTSVATIQEDGFSEADIYKVGDGVIDQDGVSIARIERNRVVLNNNGVKECLEIKENSGNRVSNEYPGAPTSPNPVPGPDAPVGSGGKDCLLEEQYVQDQLGPGFGTIIQKARLVPNTVDNVMNGFKIFAIDKSSLLGRVGLQNGDIITQVNDVSLKQPEQGFTLYQAFQDDREIRISILRQGEKPVTINCRVK